MPNSAPQRKTLRDLLSALFIYKGTILFFTLLFGGLAAAFSFLEPEIWEASVQIWVQDQGPGLGQSSGFASEAAARLKQVLTNLRQVVYSRKVLQETLRQCEQQSERASPSPPAVGLGQVNSEEQLRKLRRAVRLEAPKGFDYGSTQILYLRVRDQERERAKRLLTALLQSFRQRYEQLTTERASHLYQETTRQLKQARQALAEAEQALDAFVAQLGPGRLWDIQSIDSLAGGESDLKKFLINVNQQLVALESELIQRRALLDQVHGGGQGAAEPGAVPMTFLREHPGLEQAGRQLVEARGRLDAVAARKTPEHEDYQAMQEEVRLAERSYRRELARAVHALELDIAAKEQAAQALRRQRDSRVAELATLAGRYVEFTRLKNEVEQRRRLVADAERRRSTALNAKLSAAGQVLFSILDEPTCGTGPVRPQRTLNITVGILLGLLAGLGIALLRKHYSSTVRTEADLPVLDGEDLVLVSVPNIATPIQRVI